MRSWKQRARNESELSATRVFSYVVASDSGFAPNPFHAWCTLACSRPRIRIAAKPGDLVFGLSRGCARVVYLMRVTERLTFEEYWADPRFEAKRPDWDAPRKRKRQGDNIYRPDGAGGFVQLRSNHWDHEREQEGLEHKLRDTGTDAVLVSRDFVYFGAQGPPLPETLKFLKVTRGHRCRFTAKQVTAVEGFFDALDSGVQGSPSR